MEEGSSSEEESDEEEDVSGDAPVPPSGAPPPGAKSMLAGVDAAPAVNQVTITIIVTIPCLLRHCTRIISLIFFFLCSATPAKSSYPWQRGGPCLRSEAG